jgi:glycosyltransferase involved in cell wall biosynthesis
VARIIHVPFCYFPEAVGGTEIYVRDLARVQCARGDAVMILAPADEAQSYVHEDVPVVRYGVSNDIADVRDLYTSGKTNIAEFISAVERFSPDVLHIHGIGRGIAPEALAHVRKLGVSIVLTYHTPTTTCVRGTLLQHGAHPCDGVLDAQRCTACNLTAHGVPSSVATTIARAPALAGTLVRAVGVRGRVTTALRMRELVNLRHDQTRRVFDLADHIIAPAEWVMTLLRKLDVPAEKLTLSRQGIRIPADIPAGAHVPGRLRVVYVGRVEPGKGVHLLIRALRALPAAAIELHIYGVVQGDAHIAYRRDLRDDVARDGRVQLHEPVAPDDVVRTIAQYDVLAAPSQQFETGPLVVLEAFAAGLPVIGTRLGGIAELVQDGVNGLLVEPGNDAGWVDVLRQLAQAPDRIQLLRAGVRPPRAIEAVADDMTAVYRQVAV